MTISCDTPTVNLSFPRFGSARQASLSEKYPTVGHINRATDAQLALVRNIGPGLVKEIRRVISEGK